MIRRLALMAPVFTLAACVTPALSEDITSGEWHLIGIEGMAAPWRATLSLGPDGKVSGQAPCNRFFSTNGAALPDLALGGIGATKMACPELDKEAAYLDALQAMQRAELDQGHLFLIGPEGRVMEFVRAPVAGKPCLSCLAGQ